MIVSLGGNCAAASQLKFRGMRVCSLAFDWLAMFNDKPIVYLPKGLRTRFEDFCRYENMQELGEPRMERKRLTYKFFDTVTGYHFWHHFFKPLADRTAFDRERLVLDRRLKRFYDKISKSRNVLFILATPFPFDIGLSEGVLAALRDVFPNTVPELVVIQFGAHRQAHCELCDGVIHVETVARKINVVYDNMLTAPEWAWMDDLSLSEHAHAKIGPLRNFITKHKFKLWNTIGKSLLKDGIAKGRMPFCQIERGILFAKSPVGTP